MVETHFLHGSGRVAGALSRLCGCAGSPGLSLHAEMIGTSLVRVNEQQERLCGCRPVRNLAACLDDRYPFLHDGGRAASVVAWLCECAGWPGLWLLAEMKVLFLRKNMWTADTLARLCGDASSLGLLLLAEMIGPFYVRTSEQRAPDETVVMHLDCRCWPRR